MARPAAAGSATGSAPPMRVVFLVANCGKPRFCAASGLSPLTPITGWLDDPPLEPLPQPATARASARARTRRRIRRDGSLRASMNAPQVSAKNRIIVEVARALEARPPGVEA